MLIVSDVFIIIYFNFFFFAQFYYFILFYYLCTHIIFFHLCCLLSQASLLLVFIVSDVYIMIYLNLLFIIFFCPIWFYSLFNFAQYYLNCFGDTKARWILFSLSLQTFSSPLCSIALPWTQIKPQGQYFASPLNYSNQIYFKLSHVIDFNIHSMEWQLMLITLFTMSSQINLPLLVSSATNMFCATREPWTFTVSANINHSSIFSRILWFYLRKSVCLQAPAHSHKAC